MVEQLLIGEVTALTGIAAGRIRHYEKLGLLRADHLRNGYRVFDVDQVLDLLRIDLLRSLGVGIKDIGRLLDGEHTTLVELFNEHRTQLAAERDRLDRMIAAIDAATGGGLAAPRSEADASSGILHRLATSHRDSIGVFGRLRTPLSPTAAAMYAELLGDWELPVPPLFGQMVLPAAANTFLEQLALTTGRAELFGRLRALASKVTMLEDDDAAAQLALAWVEEQLNHPLPTDVVDVLRRVQPLLQRDPVIVHGFRTWAASITPAAARFLDEVADQVARRRLDALSVIILPPSATD